MTIIPDAAWLTRDERACFYCGLDIRHTAVWVIGEPDSSIILHPGCAVKLAIDVLQGSRGVKPPVMARPSGFNLKHFGLPVDARYIDLGISSEQLRCGAEVDR